MFANCNNESDPAVKALTSVGYGMVKLPKASIHPLQVFTKTGTTLNKLGELSSVLHPKTVALPKITKNQATATISGTRSSNIKVGFGLSILGTILGAMGGSRLGLNAGYEQAGFVQFEFQDVLEDSIEVAMLDLFLSDGDIDPKGATIQQLQEADLLYVTTSVLKTTKLLVEAKSSSGTDVAVDVPAIQGVVGVNVKVDSANEANTKIIYEGKTPLAFAFQAYRLFFKNGGFERLRIVGTDIGIAAVHGTTAGKSETLPMEGPFFNFSV